MQCVHTVHHLYAILNINYNNTCLFLLAKIREIKLVRVAVKSAGYLNESAVMAAIETRVSRCCMINHSFYEYLKKKIPLKWFFFAILLVTYSIKF